MRVVQKVTPGRFSTEADAGGLPRRVVLVMVPEGSPERWSGKGVSGSWPMMSDPRKCPWKLSLMSIPGRSHWKLALKSGPGRWFRRMALEADSEVCPWKLV